MRATVESFAEHALGERHADRIGETLAQRPGGGLHSRRIAALRVAGGHRVQLAEVAQLLDRQRMPAEVEQRVLQHRPVAIGQDEAIPVRPRRVGGIVTEVVVPQHLRDVGHAHRHAGVARLRSFDRVHAQGTDSVGELSTRWHALSRNAHEWRRASAFEITMTVERWGGWRAMYENRNGVESPWGENSDRRATMAQLDRDLGGRQPTRVGIVRRAFLSAVLVCLAYCPSVVAGEGEYLMRVQAWNAAGDSRAAFQPLADYLARRVGESVRLAVAGQVLEHWQRVRDQGGGDVVIDEAHFADYRVRRFGYRVIAKVSGLRGFSVLARPSAMILEPEDLWAKRVASLPAPSLAAVKLIELFPDAIRTPRGWWPPTRMRMRCAPWGRVGWKRPSSPPSSPPIILHTRWCWRPRKCRGWQCRSRPGRLPSRRCNSRRVVGGGTRFAGVVERGAARVRSGER